MRHIAVCAGDPGLERNKFYEFRVMIEESSVCVQVSGLERNKFYEFRVVIESSVCVQVIRLGAQQVL